MDKATHTNTPCGIPSPGTPPLLMGMPTFDCIPFVHRHLHNLIHRHKTNCSLVLVQDGVAIGGATFRLVCQHSSSAEKERRECVILDVLLLAVAQRPGVCGQGHATRLINCLKALLLRRASARKGARALLLTQADLGEQALAFWSRQGLLEGDQADSLVHGLHAWSTSHIVYDYTMPMAMEVVEGESWRCEERPSARAQALNEEEEEEQEEEEEEEERMHLEDGQRGRAVASDVEALFEARDSEERRRRQKQQRGQRSTEEKGAQTAAVERQQQMRGTCELSGGGSGACASSRGSTASAPLSQPRRAGPVELRRWSRPACLHCPKEPVKLGELRVCARAGATRPVPILPTKAAKRGQR